MEKVFCFKLGSKIVFIFLKENVQIELNVILYNGKKNKGFRVSFIY